jgi:transcriptional regulator with XRE-family HTH domain
MVKSEKAFENVLVVIGTRLQKLRTEMGFATAKAFAEKYDLPEIQYWRLENGKTNMTLKSLCRIFNIHNISLQKFFTLVGQNEIKGK